MLIKLLNNNCEMILVNPDHITKVKPYSRGIVLRFANGESEELIPEITVEEFLVKTREEVNRDREQIGEIVNSLKSLDRHILTELDRIIRSVE